MERKMAEKVVEAFASKNGPMLSILEAMNMKMVKSDGYDIYAIQKGDVTFLVWITLNAENNIKCKTVSW